MFAQAPANKGKDKGPALSPARQEIFNTYNGAATKAANLCEAIPADKYNWRPMEGVRSIAEVCGHFAGTSYLFMQGAGIKIPANMQAVVDSYAKLGSDVPAVFKTEAAIGSQKDTVAAIRAAFDAVREIIRTGNDEDLTRQVTLFGRPTTLRAALIQLIDHDAEHLGQSIAYARMNKVVPPWSK